MVEGGGVVVVVEGRVRRGREGSEGRAVSSSWGRHTEGNSPEGREN